MSLFLRVIPIFGIICVLDCSLYISEQCTLVDTPEILTREYVTVLQCARLCQGHSLCQSYNFTEHYPTGKGICTLLQNSTCISESVSQMDVELTFQLNTEYKSTSSSEWHFYGISYYKYVYARETWSDCMAICASYQAHLVTISDNQENMFVKSLINDDNNYYQKAWLGLNTFDGTSGNLYWVTGESISWTKWKHIYDSSNVAEPCATIRRLSGYWFDKNCETLYSYICERET